MRIGKTLLVVAGSAVLAACGGGDSPTDSTDSSANGPTAVTVASGKGGGADLFQAMTDAQLEAGSFTFDMSMKATVSGKEQPLLDASGAADVVDEKINQQIKMSMHDGKMGTVDMEIAMIDGVTYTDMFTVMGAPTEYKWVSIDPDADDAFSKQLAEYMRSQTGMSTTTTNMLENADELTVKEGKTDTIDGVKVTEYLVTVEKDDFDKLGVSNGAQIPLDEITYSLWVDDEYLPHRITMNTGAEAGNVDMEFNLTDFGGDVSVEPPAKDEVVSVGKLIDDLIKSGEITEEDVAALESMFGA